MQYKKPEIKSYTSRDLLEEIGPCQSQYTTTTFYTTTGNVSNGDGTLMSPGNDSVLGLIDVGDDTSTPDAYDRDFFGFDISSISGRTIVSATLRIYQGLTRRNDNFGEDPYPDMGTISCRSC